MTSGKRKGARKSNQQGIEIDDYMLDSIKASEEESKSPTSLLNTSKMLDQSDILKNGIAADIGGLSNLSLERGDSLSSTACTSTLSIEHEHNGEVYDIGYDDSFGRSSGLGNNMLDEAESIACTNEMMATGLGLDCGTSEGSCLINEGADCDGKEIKGDLDSLHLEALLVMDHDTDGQSNDISLEVIKDSDVAAYAQFSEQASSNMINNDQTANSGEWIAYWDDFHMRTYFYNAGKEESTWDPPSGMEHLVYGNMSDETTNMVAGLSELDNDQMDFRMSDEVQASCDLLSPPYLAKGLRNDARSLSPQLDGIAGNCLSADNGSSTNATNKKKKVRRTKSNRKLSISSEGLPSCMYLVFPSTIPKAILPTIYFNQLHDHIIAFLTPPAPSVSCFVLEII